tara:strand:+ start:4658 stop:5185 length:528 start_codon:yes stop_codon:yes gene_type:complete
MKQKICKICKVKFEPLRPLQMVCSYKCGIEYTKKQESKKWQKEKKVLKEKLLTKKDYLNILQKVFNTYIRTRDKGKPCISCDKKLTKENTNAGHFYSVGAYPNLRFNENNVHNQCIECNLHKHGNVLEYSLRLPNRIGVKEYNSLQESRNIPLKIDITELKELILYYKEKTKQLN